MFEKIIYFCAYRFIAEEIAPVTNPAEMTEVEKAAECSIAPVAQDIADALGLLSPNPFESSQQCERIDLGGRSRVEI